MIRLVRLLATPEGAGAVEADLARYYGLDLLDLWRPDRPLSWRQVMVRVRHLRNLPDAALAWLEADGEPWTLAHDIADETRRWIEATARPGERPEPHHQSPYRKHQRVKAEAHEAKASEARARAADQRAMREAAAAYEAQQREREA